MSDTTASSAYATAYRQSITDPDSFWLGVAREEIQWTTPPTRAVDGSEAPFYHWFPDGQLNTCYNAVDRHVAAGRGDQAAYIWDSAVTGVKETITYAQLQEQVAAFAGALAAEGVGKGMARAQPRVVKGDARHRRRLVQPAAQGAVGLPRLGEGAGRRKVRKNAAGGGVRQRVGKRRGVFGRDRLQTVAQRVHARVRDQPCGELIEQARVEYRKRGSQTVLDERVLDPVVRQDGKGRDLRAGAGGRRHGDEHRLRAGK